MVPGTGDVTYDRVPRVGEAASIVGHQRGRDVLIVSEESREDLEEEAVESIVGDWEVSGLR